MGAAALVLLVAAVLYIVFGAGFPSLFASMRGAVSHSVAVPAAGAPTQAAATARSNVTLAVGSSVGLAGARAEDIIAGHTLDPHRDMAPEVDAAPDKLRYVQRPYCDGTVIYSQRMQKDTGSASAHIILVKAGVTNDGPWDIRSYYSRNPGFPADFTLDQLYRSTRFDAYRALVEYSTREAFEAVGQRTLT